jgi:hypothetical protein
LELTIYSPSFTLTIIVPLVMLNILPLANIYLNMTSRGSKNALRKLSITAFFTLSGYVELSNDFGRYAFSVQSQQNRSSSRLSVGIDDILKGLQDISAPLKCACLAYMSKSASLFD